MPSPGTTTASPITLVAGSFAAGIAGAFVYNQYLSRVRQEEREPPHLHPSSTSNNNRSNFTFVQQEQETTPPTSTTHDALSVGVLNHLARVYATLGGTTLAAVLGVVVQRQTNFSSTLAALAFLGLGVSISMSSSSSTASSASSAAERRQARRNALIKLLACGLFNGMAMGDLVTYALRINPQLVPLALASTTAVFASFATAATLSPRRSLLYLYGVLGSAASALLVAGVASALLPHNRLLFNTHLYGGLVMFVGYVCADSQLIIERAEQGDRDHVTHAWLLFTDLSGLFVKLLVMLVEQEQKKKKKRDDDEEEEEQQRRGRRRH